MIKIAAIDDNDVFLAKILDIISTYFEQEHIEIQMEVYNNPSDLVWDLEQNSQKW